MRTWADIRDASNADIIAWAGAQSWAQAMAGCQQDAQWHAEGDVWTHTKMVCAELEKLAEWAALDRNNQLKLLMTALFHDSGKPSTTAVDPETGRTRSSKHSIVGAGIARRELRELGCDLATREDIAALVRFHGRPPYLLEKEKPEREVIYLSWLASNHLLYLFSLADHRGRYAVDIVRSEETLHLWKDVAEETACLDQPYHFANDHARFLFYRNQLSSLHHLPHEVFRCTVTLMSGLPGSGKDTWLDRKKMGLPVVSLDSIRAELAVEATQNQGEVIQIGRERCREHLRVARNFAFNATNIMRRTRSRWIDLFASYSARIEIVYIEPPLPVILAQNSRRSEPVPERVLLGLLEKLEPPTITECHAMTFVQ